MYDYVLSRKLLFPPLTCAPHSKPLCITLFIIRSMAVGFSIFFFLLCVIFFHGFVIPSPLLFLLFFLLIFFSPLRPATLFLFRFISGHVMPVTCLPLPIRSSPRILVFWPLSAGRCSVPDASLTHIPLLGVCNDHGKTYALYAITVFRKNPDGSEDTWKTYRRYSDFHDFHMRITEQVQ